MFVYHIVKHFKSAFNPDIIFKSVIGTLIKDFREVYNKSQLLNITRHHLKRFRETLIMFWYQS